MVNIIIYIKLKNCYKKGKNNRLRLEHIHPSWYGDLTEKNQLARSLALLFMTEIVKDETLMKGKGK